MCDEEKKKPKIARKEDGQRESLALREEIKQKQEEKKSIKCDAQLDHYTPDQNDCSKLIDIVLKEKKIK